MSSTALLDAVRNITDWERTSRPATNRPKATEIFGSLTFNDEVQKRRLPRDVYRALRKTITAGAPLDPSAADIIAAAMKDWAVEHGATHYTHWFQPMTGITAEKHDAFLAPSAERSRALAAYSGKEPAKAEPDASSFPTVRMRSPCAARASTACDPTRPPWLRWSGCAGARRWATCSTVSR
jgi:glutamine synthetase